MDRKLVAWARSVKARRRGGRGELPPLWLFADRMRLPDPAAALEQLPARLTGVVVRGMPAATTARLVELCQARGIPVSAADQALAARLQCGFHMRGGKRRAGALPAFLTSSAHSVIELRRARRAGAALIFLSPAFPTASHPGQRALGEKRWSLYARRGGGVVAALGGIDGATVRQLPRWCRHIGAIGALAPEDANGRGEPRPFHVV